MCHADPAIAVEGISIYRKRSCCLALAGLAIYAGIATPACRNTTLRCAGTSLGLLAMTA